MEQLKEVLKEVIRRTPALRAYQVIECWKKTVPEEISKNTEPIKVKGGTLFVSAKNAVWANELSLLKKGLIEKINTAMGKKAIKDIKFQGGRYAEK